MESQDQNGIAVTGKWNKNSPLERRKSQWLKQVPFGIAAWWLSDIVVKCVFASTNCSNSEDCHMAPITTHHWQKLCNSTWCSQGPKQFSFLIVQSAVPHFSRKGTNYVSDLILYSHPPHTAVLLCHIKLPAWHDFYWALHYCWLCRTISSALAGSV